jgi:hypothetical protein
MIPALDRSRSLSTRVVAVVVAMTAFAPCAHAQQVPDSSFAPALGTPAFPRGTGPVVLVDEGHHNFHTLGGRFYAFGRLVASDGFVTRPSQGRITSQSLAGAKILVISNALAERNVDDWMLPTPSAFDSSEIATIRGWVQDGGGLLLIADHMPFPGAVSDLAAAFGFQLANGFLFKMPDEDGDFTLSRSRGELRPHPITDGKLREARIDSVHVFTGEGFRSVAPVETLLVIRGPLQLLMPQVAWQFSPLTPRLSATGLMQGAVRRFGKGRVGMFGEAAMFSAQLAGPHREPMGMNSPAAPQNARFVRNVVRWLAQVP